MVSLRACLTDMEDWRKLTLAAQEQNRQSSFQLVNEALRQVSLFELLGLDDAVYDRYQSEYETLLNKSRRNRQMEQDFETAVRQTDQRATEFSKILSRLLQNPQIPWYFRIR